MNRTYIQIFEILKKVYGNHAYLGLILDNADFGNDRSFALRIIYGVIEKDTEFEYHLGYLCKKRPKLALRIILKIGMYMIKYMDSIPEYTAVNETVELAKELKKSENAGFINSVLRSFIKDKNRLPSDPLEKLSVSESVPLWLCRKYKEQYSESEIGSIINFGEKLTHIRVNSLKYTLNEFYSFLRDLGCAFVKSNVGAFIKNTSCCSELISEGKVFIQSLGSIRICDAFKAKFASDGEYKILDMCSAPGGKTVYLAENFPNSSVVALELYDNRINLIENYLENSGVENVQVFQYDSTLYNPKYENSFDMILCDVPCMGLGVVSSNPDILLHRKEEELRSITKTQNAILQNAAKYLKQEGMIVYSTCSTLKEENHYLTDEFCQIYGFIKGDELINIKESGEFFYLCRITK